MSPPRFLIDENLSIALPQRAHARGYEATHVTQLGLKGAKDWALMELVAEHDWVLVTNNAVEFRGRYQKVEIHPGIVFIVPNVRRMGQIELFEAALDEVLRRRSRRAAGVVMRARDRPEPVSRSPPLRGYRERGHRCRPSPDRAGPGCP